MTTMRVGTPQTPTTPSSIRGAVRRKTSLTTTFSDPRPVRNTFTRAGSVAMGQGNLRTRATIGPPDEASRLQDKWAMSRARTLQRSATIHNLEIQEVTSGASFDTKKAPVRVEASSPGSETATVNLARKYRLTLAETQNAVSAFKDAKKNPEDGIDLADFRSMMCCVFDVSEINPAVLTLAHKQANMQQSATIEDFLAWYVQNMFTQVNTLNASQDQHQGNALTYTLSKKHMVSVSVIDKIKSQFDKFDLDKSGEIDFEEFADMMRILLKTDKASLSDMRLKKFWQDIEKATTGDIGFAGFTAWYLKYFDQFSGRDGYMNQSG